MVNLIPMIFSYAGFAATVLTIGIGTYDELCMKVDIIGLDIAEWFITVGIIGIIVAIFIVTHICIDYTNSLNVVSLISFIYNVIITSIIAAIFFRSSRDCLYQEAESAIFTLIYLIIMWGSLFGFLLQRKDED